MPRPTSLNVTTELLDQFLTYNPDTGELRTRATRKLLDPVRPTKIGGISINPARAAFAMGNLYIWNKVRFKDGNPRNLRLDNLVRAKANTYIQSGEPRKPYTRKPGPDSCVGLGGLGKPEEPPSLPWQKRINAPQTNLLPTHSLWSHFLKRHFSYNPDTGALTSRTSGKVLKVTDKYGAPRTVDIPKYVDSKHRSLRIDRLAWLLATNRLPDKETTRLTSPDLHATSIQWHPEGIPRASARPVVKPSGGQWFAYVYYNRHLTKEGCYDIEEEAMAAATDAANDRIGITEQWRSSLVTLADYMAGDMKDYYRDDEPTPEESPLDDLDDDEEPAPPATPAPVVTPPTKTLAHTDSDYLKPLTPAPVRDSDFLKPIIRVNGLIPDCCDDEPLDDDEDDGSVPVLPPIIVDRKPWSYTPCSVTLEDLAEFPCNPTDT